MNVKNQVSGASGRLRRVFLAGMRQLFRACGLFAYMLPRRSPRSSKTRAARDGALSIRDKLYHVRSELPSITHIDYSARVQTVHKETNPRYHALISAFKRRTGCGVVVNTSFNVRGEPIVRTPAEAYRCFMRTELDALVIGDHLFLKRPAGMERAAEVATGSGPRLDRCFYEKPLTSLARRRPCKPGTSHR